MMIINSIWDRTDSLLASSLSLDIVPHLCRLRTIRCRHVRGWDFIVLATYSGKPDTSAIPLCERPTMHWEWRDGKSSVYTSYVSARSGVGRWSTMLSGSANPFMFWRIRVRVDIRRFGTCVCRVVRKPQLGLIDSNRCAPRLWRLDHRRIIYEIMILLDTSWYKMRWDA